MTLGCFAYGIRLSYFYLNFYLTNLIFILKQKIRGDE